MISRYQQLILENKYFILLSDAAKQLKIPGFNGVSIYEAGQFFIKEIKKNSITTRASALAFNFFLAIFPAIIFLFTLIPYIPVDNFQAKLMLLLRDVLPSNAYEAAQTTLNDIINNQNGGLLSFGFIMAIFFSTNGIMSLMECFNKAEHAIDSRSGFRKRLIAAGLTLQISVLLITAIILTIFSEVTLQYLINVGILKEDYMMYLLIAGKWIIILALYYFAVSLLYFFGPAGKMKFRFFSAGSSLATLLSIATSTGFAFYVNNFGNYNKLYGSIGTLMVILIWLYLNSLILLIGFELNASIHFARNKNIPQG